MIKAIAFLDDPLWLIIIACLVVYIFSLRRRMAGLDDYRLWLSRKERRAYARKQLEAADEERELARFQKNLDIVQGKPKENQ